MKKLIIYFLIFLGILSCKKEKSLDNEQSLAALNQKEWFQQMKVPCDNNTICNVKTYVYIAMYNREPVVYSMLTTNNPACDLFFSVQLRNLNGEVIKSYIGPYSLSVFEREVTDKKLIYRCDQ